MSKYTSLAQANAQILKLERKQRNLQDNFQAQSHGNRVRVQQYEAEIYKLRADLHNRDEADITPESLAAAYDSAERVSEYRKGDVMIRVPREGEFRVWTATTFVSDIVPSEDVRCLHRAPVPSNTELLASIVEVARKREGGGIVLDDKCDSRIMAETLNEAGVKAPELEEF